MGDVVLLKKHETVQSSHMARSRGEPNIRDTQPQLLPEDLTLLSQGFMKPRLKNTAFIHIELM